MRGRPKKSNEDRRGHRPSTGVDFSPEVEIPERPKGLGFSGRREFNIITRMLAEKGLISKLDGKAIAGYCEAFEGAEEAKRLIKRHGQMVPVYIIDKESGQPVLDPEGKPYVREWRNNPAVANHVKYLALMRGFLDMFGLSPKSRLSLKLADKPKENPLDALMKKSVVGFQSPVLTQPRPFTQPAAPAVNEEPVPAPPANDPGVGPVKI